MATNVFLCVCENVFSLPDDRAELQETHVSGKA